MRKLSGISTVGELPHPFDFSNPSILKDPYMWVLFISKANIAKGHLRSKFGTRGPLLEAFEDSLSVEYPRGKTELVRSLSTLFMQVGMIVINHPASEGLDDLMTTINPTLKEAIRIITELDSDLISASLGPRAGLAFSRARLDLHPRHFAAAAGEALKSALKVGQPTGSGKRGRDGGQDAGSPRTCFKCKDEVTGPFAEHRKVCKGRKRK
jgi:hypothetical protein